MKVKCQMSILKSTKTVQVANTSFKGEVVIFPPALYNRLEEAMARIQILFGNKGEAEINETQFQNILQWLKLFNYAKSDSMEVASTGQMLQFLQTQYGDQYLTTLSVCGLTKQDLPTATAIKENCWIQLIF